MAAVVCTFGGDGRDAGFRIPRKAPGPGFFWWEPHGLRLRRNPWSFSKLVRVEVKVRL